MTSSENASEGRKIRTTSKMNELYRTARLIKLRPECEKCRLCEQGVGLVYVLGDELSQISNLRIPLSRTSAGANYIARTSDGWCPCFDLNTNKCRIYKLRPLCCRIYPLDLMEIDKEVWWVVHSDCPISQSLLKEKRFDLLASITVSVERCLSPNQLHEWLMQDRLSFQIEDFCRESYRIIKLRKLGDPVAFSLLTKY